MPPNPIRSISEESDGTVVVTERRYGCYGWGLFISVLLLAFVIIVGVILLVESDDAVTLLSVLLGALVVVAILSFVFLEWQRRRALARRDSSATEWINRTLSQSTNVEVDSPTAPPSSGRTSWVHWAPWKSSAPPVNVASSQNGAYPQYNDVPSAPPKGYTDYDF